MSQNPYRPVETTGFQTRKQLRKQRGLSVVAWVCCYVAFTLVFMFDVFFEGSFIAINAEYFTAGLIAFCLLISIATPGEPWTRIGPLLGFLICIFGHLFIFGIVSAFFAIVFGELPVAS